MIESTEQLLDIPMYSAFQRLVLSNIKDLLGAVDLENLNEVSNVEVKNFTIYISLIHKQEPDSRVILNLFEDYISLWYSECNFYTYNDFEFDIELFKDVYENCLRGTYSTTDYYYKNKVVFSYTQLPIDGVRGCGGSRTSFYRFYKWFHKKEFTTKEVTYKSFLK